MTSALAMTPRPRRWTRLEYDRLVDLGVFAPGERLELLDGLLVVGEPHGTRHAAAIRRVLAALHRALGDDWQIDSQLPIALDPDSEPEPDVMVVPRDPGAYRSAHPSRPALIGEIADTSYRTHREYKSSLYARAGVGDYWLLDLLHDVLEVHRDPRPSADAPCGFAYRSVAPLRGPAMVAPLVAPDRTIAVGDLLP